MNNQNNKKMYLIIAGIIIAAIVAIAVVLIMNNKDSNTNTNSNQNNSNNSSNNSNSSSNSINEEKQSAEARSVEMFALSIDNSITTLMFNQNYSSKDIEIINRNGQYYVKSGNVEEKVQYSGSPISCSNIEYDNDTGYVGMNGCTVGNGHTKYQYCNKWY